MSVQEVEDSNRLGSWLTGGRLRAGLTQAAVAQYLGVHAGRVSEWEQGMRVPTPHLLLRLAELFAGPAPIESAGDTTVLVRLNQRGFPWIVGTNTKVREMVLALRDREMSPDRVVEDFPHLSLAHVHAALAWYHGHRAEMDAEIEAEDRFAERMRQSAPPVPAIERLRAQRSPG